MRLESNDMLGKLKMMQLSFAKTLPDRLAAIDVTLQACCDEPTQQNHGETLHRLLHTLAGAAGTFGFDALGMQAKKFEYQVEQWLKKGVFNSKDLERLALQLPELQIHIDHPPLDMSNPGKITAAD
jgi:HPt (histidine-containing phosphotransfer) domain-containing protein